MRASTYGCAGAGAHGPRRREPLHKIAPHHLKQVSLKKGEEEEEEETAAGALVSRGAEGEDEVEVAELLVHHEGEDAHHRRAAVVELDRALRELLLVGIVVPELEAAGAAVLREVLEAVADVPRELGVAAVVAGHVEVHAAERHDQPAEVASREGAEGAEAT